MDSGSVVAVACVKALRGMALAPALDVEVLGVVPAKRCRRFTETCPEELVVPPAP
jgi:hypothetical protein